MLKSKASFKDYEGGDICLNPLGIVFVGKNKKGNNPKFTCQVCDVDRYPTSHYTNLMTRMNSCVKNNEIDKGEIWKVINWYADVERVIH